MINWYSKLTELGVPDSILNKKSQPCPFCGGKDRFRWTDYKSNGEFICNQCGSGNGFEFVKRYFSVDFNEALKMVNPEITSYSNGREFTQQKQYDYAKSILRERYSKLIPAKNTPAHKYLNNRGIALPKPFPMIVSDGKGGSRKETMGCFFLEDYENGNHAMVWKVIEPTTMRINGLHYTAIDSDGNKANVHPVKKFSSAICELKPNQFKLSPLCRGNADYYVIAEGIESALAVRQIMKELAPKEPLPSVFASLTAGMMAKFKAFHGMSPEKYYYICADRDASYTGQKAAMDCAKNLRENSGITPDNIHIFMPNKEGMDWNDVLQYGTEDDMLALAKPISI